MELIGKFSDYTEHQFKNFIEAIRDAETEAERDRLVRHFIDVVPHPAKSDLLYYPGPGTDGSVEGVIEIIKEWCTANGLPGFKSQL